MDASSSEEREFDALLTKFWVTKKRNYKKLAKQLISSGEVFTQNPQVICRYTHSKEESTTHASFDGGVRYPVGLSRPIYKIDRYEVRRICFDMAWLDASIEMYLRNKSD
jgi:hypothetical protein